GDEGYVLRYQFETGQVLKTIETTSGTMPMNVQMRDPAGMAAGGADAPDGYQGSTTIDVTTTRILTIEDVADDGTASGALKIEYMFASTSTRIANQTIDYLIEYEDGRVTTSGTMQRQTPPEKIVELQNMLNRTYRIRIDPLGGIEPQDEDYDEMWRQVMGRSAVGVDLRKLTRATAGLPEEAVQIGDTWEQQYTADDENDSTTGSSIMELRDVKSIDGRDIAVITGTSTLTVQNADGEPSAAPMMGQLAGGMEAALKTIETHTAFEIHMDLDHGQVMRQSADITLDMEQTMTMDLQAMFGGNQPMELTMDMSVEDAQMHSETSTEFVEVQANDEEG
ncbi:MAG: hypothetical protein ACLFWB_04940, partial [Armatimonadota bacterium]